MILPRADEAPQRFFPHPSRGALEAVAGSKAARAYFLKPCGGSLTGVVHVATAGGLRR